MSNGIMSEKYRSTFLLGAVLYIVLQTSTAAIIGTVCDPNANGDTVCQGVDPNAECPTSTTSCACKTGYKIDPKDDTVCLLSITQVPCNSDEGNDGNAICKGLDENSECPADASTCACKTGYTGTTGTCMKQPITQVPCNSDEGNDGNAICKGLDENSECPADASTCACKTGYTGTTGTCMKQPITEVDCTPDNDSEGDAKCQDLDENSECPTGATNCACKTGYTGSDTCSEESSADSVKVTTTVITMSLLSFIVRRIM